jgi:hypothetical protein
MSRRYFHQQKQAIALQDDMNRATQHFRIHLVSKCFRGWIQHWERNTAWKIKVNAKEATWGPKRVHMHLGKEFRAKEIFSKEGKDTMAIEYRKWYVIVVFYPTNNSIHPRTSFDGEEGDLFWSLQ